MAAPVVQSLDQVIADYNPVYQPQTDLINSQMAGLGAKYDVQKTALGAEKVQGFNAINNSATGRGMSFSGIPLDEQATYLSTKYLPGMQGIDNQKNTENIALQGALNTINSDKRSQAMATRNAQQSSLEKYLSDEQQRAFTAEQNRLDRAATAANAAASRASSAAKIPSTAQFLTSAFSGYNPNAASWYTEKSVIPALMANYGMDQHAAAQLAYQYRKTTFKEGYGKM